MTGPRRFHTFDREAIESLILADLAKHGPSVISDVRTRLHQVMGDDFVKRALDGLIEAGKVLVTIQGRSKAVRYQNGTRTISYQARVYELMTGQS